jgi:hypothetical protein
MKKIIALLILVILLKTAPGTCANEDQAIPIVGLDERGSASVKLIPHSVYQKSLREAYSTVHESAISALESQKQDPHSSWTLQTIGIGVGLCLQAGLGPIYSVSGSGRIRFVFSNALNPVYPD